MDYILNLFSDFQFKDWFGLSMTILVSFGILIYQKNSTNKKDKRDDELLNFINGFKEKDLLEKDLEVLKEQQLNIQVQVKEHIPRLARQSILKEQKEIHEKALYSHFKEWKVINKEINVNSIEIKLEKELVEKLVNDITPKFELLTRLDDLKTKITLSSILIALLSTFITNPFNYIITIPLLIYIFKNLYLYLELKGISENFITQDFKLMFNSVIYVISGGLLFLSFTFITLMFTNIAERGFIMDFDFGIYLPLLFIIILISLSMFLLRYINIIFSKVEKLIRAKFKIIQ